MEINGVVPPFPGRLEQGVNIPGEDAWILESSLFAWVTQKVQTYTRTLTTSCATSNEPDRTSIRDASEMHTTSNVASTNNNTAQETKSHAVSMCVIDMIVSMCVIDDTPYAVVQGTKPYTAKCDVSVNTRPDNSLIETEGK